MLTIRLPRDIDDRLTLLALRTGKSKLYYAREAILTHLDELEERFLALHGINESDEKPEDGSLDFND